MNKPTTDAGEMLRRIDRFLDEGKTVDELKDDLRNEGIDPDELLKEVKARFAQHLWTKKYRDESE